MRDNKFLVALVEDDADQAYLVERTLTNWMSMYQTESFSTGEDFFAALHGHFDDYDAVVVDYMLPKMNGLEILKRLHELGFDKPIIFLTVLNDKDIIHEALKYGACDYVMKTEGYLNTLPVIIFKSIDRYRCQQHKEAVQGKVQKLKEFYEQILNTIPFAIVGINSKFEISYANLQSQDIFFMDPSDLIDKNILELFDPEFVSDAGLIDHIKKVKKGGQPVYLQRMKFINSKHQKKFLDIDVFEQSTDFGDNILLLINDVTRNVELEHKLVQTEKLASLGKLLTGITHELNNRMGPILSYAQLLMSRQQDKRSMKWLESIEESAQGVKTIVESLIYFSSSTTHQNKERVHINELIENTLTLVKYKLHSKNISIRQSLAKDIPEVLIDCKQISKVLLNIVTNSYEAMRTQGGELTVSSDFTGHHCRITIEDTGEGIREEIMNDIFDPFFTTKTDKKNAGLGLSIAYNLLQNHNGAIQISSQPGKGTTVKITLPYENIAQKDANQDNEPQEKNKLSNVLIIEDDEILRDVMKDILEDMYQVDTAENGDKARIHLETKNYNAILTDIRMPGMDGPTLYHWVKQNHPGMEKRMIFTTGDTYDPDTNRFLDSIENNFISKPFNINDLRNLIKKVIP